MQRMQCKQTADWLEEPDCSDDAAARATMQSSHEGAKAGEKEVEVTLLGGNTMLAGASKGGNEERPLPKPLPQKKPLLLLTYRPSASDAPGGGAPSTSASAAPEDSRSRHACSHSAAASRWPSFWLQRPAKYVAFFDGRSSCERRR